MKPGGIERLGARIKPFVEKYAEATAACLFAMVQGNLFALTLGHWLVASRTGALAALATTAALAATRLERRSAVALVLGLGTTAADWMVHPGGFGPFFFEAVVTGLLAAALCLAVQSVAACVARLTRVTHVAQVSSAGGHRGDRASDESR